MGGITEKIGLKDKDEISLGPTEFEVSLGHWQNAKQARSLDLELKKEFWT